MGNTPNIRFKGFTDDWEQRKLGEVVEKVIGGGTPKTSVAEYWDGDIPWIQSSNIQENEMFEFDIPKTITREGLEKSAAKLIPENSIAVVTHVGVGKLVFVPFSYTTSQDFTSLSDLKTDAKFTCYSLYKRIQNDLHIVQGSAIKGITKEDLLTKEIAVPNIEEQKKIGDYFRGLDHLITLHQRKCNEMKKMKKFMLQKMFPKNGQKNPEIRFEGFTDDWEQRKLGEICERVTRKNKDNESELPLTIASQYGLIDQRDFFNKVVAAKDMTNYYLLKKGEFAYNKSYSNGFDYGSIKRLNAYEQGCLSTLYICFSIHSDEVDSDYLESFFDTLNWYDDVSMICAEGARNHGLLNVDTKAFFTDVRIKLPSQIKEQKKIAAFFNNLDHLITLHQRKCNWLKKLKEHMLKNIYPRYK